jgi:WD40 repeat protein
MSRTTILLDLPKESVEALHFSPNGELVAFAAKKHGVRLHHWKSGESTGWKTPAPAEAIQFSRDGKRLAVGLRGRGVLIYDLEGNKLSDTRSEQGHGSLTWSPDDAFVVVGDYEPFYAVFDAATGKKLHEFDADVFDDSGRTGAAFTANDDASEVCTIAYNDVYAWAWPEDPTKLKKKPSRRILKTGKTHGHVWSMALSADNGLIAAVFVDESFESKLIVASNLSPMSASWTRPPLRPKRPLRWRTRNCDCSRASRTERD